MRAYGAQIRLEKLGDRLLVLNEVTLQDHKREDFTLFETSIRPIGPGASEAGPTPRTVPHGWHR
jgi:hypothetical protein